MKYLNFKHLHYNWWQLYIIFKFVVVFFLIMLICRIQPVYVVDVAGAIVAALKDDGTSMGKVYELGGPEVFTVHELVNSLPHLSS
jgi:uncharacterized protein YbjT (DUF2867 family)